MSVDLTGFLGVVLLAYLIPGPDFLVIVRAATRRPALGFLTNVLNPRAAS